MEPRTTALLNELEKKIKDAIVGWDFGELCDFAAGLYYIAKRVVTGTVLGGL